MQVFTPQQCADIVSAFDACDNQVAEGELQNDPYYRNSFGLYQLPKALAHADHVTSLVKRIHPNIKFDSVYTRAYHEHSHLLVHTDRPDLDLTLSVCLEIIGEHVWGLKVSNLPWSGEWNNEADHTRWLKSYNTTHLDVGFGSLCEGRKYPHWRDTLVCKPNERLVYAFYHWSFTPLDVKIEERTEPFTREQLALDVLARLLVDTSFAVADKLLDQVKHG